MSTLYKWCDGGDLFIMTDKMSNVKSKLNFLHKYSQMYTC